MNESGGGMGQSQAKSQQNGKIVLSGDDKHLAD
jgi:hypothetical protein